MNPGTWPGEAPGLQSAAEDEDGVVFPRRLRLVGTTSHKLESLPMPEALRCDIGFEHRELDRVRAAARSPSACRADDLRAEASPSSV
jgi:hypothetical protein